MDAAVKGKVFYATPPTVGVGHSTADVDLWHVGQGRLLPSTSVAQYVGTIAMGCGVPDAKLTETLPDLKNFTGAQVAGNPMRNPPDQRFMAGPGRAEWAATGDRPDSGLRQKHRRHRHF